MNEDHFIVTDGDLYVYDASKPDWHSKPVRTNYSLTHRIIRTVADLKATLRAGAYAWPGGYPLFLLTTDGGVLSFETVRREFRTIASAVRDDRRSSGWRVEATDVNYDEHDLRDSHTGERIPSAYEPQEA